MVGLDLKLKVEQTPVSQQLLPEVVAVLKGLRYIQIILLASYTVLYNLVFL